MTAVRRGKSGQFLIASALLIAILFISVSSLLSSTIITDVKLLKDDFRKDAMQIVSNFRGASNLAIVYVSRELEHRSRLFDYKDYTTLEEYPDAETYGVKMMTDWQNTILQQYAGRSINLTITNLEFECKWNSSEYYSEYYSKASATLNLDILSYGFYGLKQNVTSELRLQILDRAEQNTNLTFTIRLQEEKSLPVTDLDPSFIKVLYMLGTLDFVEVDPSNIWVTYLGSGFYNITFSASNHEPLDRIKMILRDGRGIVVAAIAKGGVLVPQKNDTAGPITTKVLANPNPCTKPSTTKLTATVNDTSTGANIIISAEYFVDTIGGSGSGTIMSASDGYFDSPVENVQAQLSTASLSSGNHTIYVHGRDAVGNWGNFSSVVLTVTETQQPPQTQQKMHISDISVRATPHGMSDIRIVATVTVVDADRKHVAGALVYGHWSGSVTGSMSLWTGTDGKVTFIIEYSGYWRGGRGWWGGRLTFTFTVDNIVKTGWTYDKSANEETSGTDTYP
jgi:hypothetical protein